MHGYGGGEGRGGEDVGGEVGDEVGGIDGGAVVDGEHILGVGRVGGSGAPGFVSEGRDEAGSVVTLVEGDGYESWWWWLL